MRIVFMGTPDFASECLKKLKSAGHDIIEVYAPVDKPKGRRAVLTRCDVKIEAEKLCIPVRQPASLRNGEEAEHLRALNPDLIVVVAYGKILPKEILSVPKYGCVNVHASLLPKYRGAAPIQWAIINGEKETGITTMYMDEGLDTGDMILSEKTKIGENECFSELWERLKAIGAELLIKTVGLIEKGDAPRIPQSGESSYSPVITHETEKIDISGSAAEIHNLIRGLSYAPGAYVLNKDKKLKLLSSRKTGEKGKEAGEVTVRKNKIFITAGDGEMLEILRLKEEGGKEMDAASFVNGRKISDGDRVL